jgi:hypothetical protein
VSQSVTVVAVATTLNLPTPATTVYGQGQSATASVTEADGSTPSGTVQFSLDGQPLGSPVAVSGGSATSPSLSGLAPGSHTLTAAFTPTDPAVDAPASSSVVFVVDQAASSTSVSVASGSITATVAAVAPGAGTPTGTVTFEVDGTRVGTATLSGGTATLDDTVPTTARHQVAAVYGGDADFTGSSASTSLAGPSRAPTIVAHRSSQAKRTRYGWYDAPVRITFTCDANGSALTAPCPKPVTLSKNGAGQSVTRTISAVDGQTATVVVSGIDIDATTPSLTVGGVRRSASYPGSAPALVVHATDRVSGVASTVKRFSTGTASGPLQSRVVHYTVTATSRSGETRTVRGSYTVLGLYLEGLTVRDGVFELPIGGIRTIVVHSTQRPYYLYAGPSPVTPVGGGIPFVRTGPDTWALGVELFDGLFHPFSIWDLGVRIGSVTHVLAVRLTG